MFGSFKEQVQKKRVFKYGTPEPRIGALINRFWGYRARASDFIIRFLHDPPPDLPIPSRCLATPRILSLLPENQPPQRQARSKALGLGFKASSLSASGMDRQLAGSQIDRSLNPKP